MLYAKYYLIGLLKNTESLANNNNTMHLIVKPEIYSLYIFT